MCANQQLTVKDAWFFDDGYLPWVAETVTRELDLKTDDAFVDIGGGTGNDTIRIATKAGLKGRAAGVT